MKFNTIYGINLSIEEILSFISEFI